MRLAARLALVVVALSATVADARQVIQKKPRELAPPELGASVAPVVIERFCDVAQSPCAGIDSLLTQLVARHKDGVRVVFRTRPLRHVKVSEALAQALWEAHTQGRFFAFRDAIYAARPSDRFALEGLAARAGLDVDAFARALADGRHAAHVDEDEAWAARFGVEAVPALVWNGRRLPLPANRMEDYERLYATARTQADARLATGVSPPRLYATILRDELRARAAQVLEGATAVGIPPRAPARRRPRRVNVPVEGAPARGADDAPVRVVVFADYQCPHCRSLASTLARLEEAYPGRVSIVWKHAPLPDHPDALLAAHAAVCAQRQGKFWEYQVRLYAQPYRLERAQLLTHAAQLGLDVDRFTDDLDAGRCDARVADDLADARTLGIAGQTPILFVNGIQLTGDQPLGSLRAVVDDELSPGALAQLIP
jgi:protein-disulfide isomerase